jgi:MFS family permease
VVQGIGAAMLAPAGLSLLVTSYPGDKERSHALGVYGAITSAGFASGAVLGGLLVEVTWRLVFFVNVPVGIALLAASMRLLPRDPPGSGRDLDVPGAVTVTAGVALLVLAIARAGDTRQITQPALAAAVAILLLAAFVIRERRARAPLLNLALLKDRAIAGANLTLIAVGAFSAGQVLLVTLYLQEGRDLSPVLHRPVLHPAGGRGVRAVRPGRPARARPGSAARAGHRPGHRPGRPIRSRRRRADRFASPAARRPVRARGRPGSARSPPPWPAPAARSPPAPRARPAPC